MIRDLLKWVAPGVVTVLCGTAAALAMATPAMFGTLAEEGANTLSAAGADWARIKLVGRAVQLTGTASSESERDVAIASLRGVPGMGQVDAAVTIAPLAAPFRTQVLVENSAVTVFGSVPNENFRQRLLARGDLASVDVQIRAGQPTEDAWWIGLEYAIELANLVERGHFELSDRTLNSAGRASSQRALGHLQMALAQMPAGFTIGSIDVEPVLVAPYTWSAKFDGQRIAISGFVPEERVVDRLRTADVSGLPIATGLSLASGAPEGFAEQTRLLLEQLALLEHGEAHIVDGVRRLVGVPPSVEVAQAVTEALTGTGSIIDLSSPRIADYWISINRQSGGTLVFDGFVPDEATRREFSELDGADVNFLKFGSGAPQAYRRAVDFGLTLLDHLSEGRIAINGEALSVSGLAATPSDYKAVLDLVDTRLPQGLTLGQVGVEAPRAANYAFSARRDASGAVVLDGMLPNPDVEAALLAVAGPTARSKVTFASGETPNFVASAQQALSFLQWLHQGRIAYEGTGWSVEGEPRSDLDRASIEAEFAVRALAASGWSLALTAPAVRPGFADPYVWSAERLPDGSFLFEGNVPAESIQAYLKVHVPSRVTDTSVVANGAPEGFAASVRAAVDALLQLDEGRAAYDGDQWILTGRGAASASRDAALTTAEILGLDDASSISVPEAVPVTPYVWSALKTADGITFDGAVPAESLQRFLAVRAGDGVEDRTTLREGAPEDFAADVMRAMDLLALVSEGEIVFDGSNWSASGTAIVPDATAEASALLGASAPRWQLAFMNPALPEVESSPQASPEGPQDADKPAEIPGQDDRPVAESEEPASEPVQPPATLPSGLAQCQARLAELSAHNAILFQSGAAIIAASAATELDAFATALQLCPEATIEVEGHTDADGDDRLNLALSVARAEAVVNALIERGIAPARLYAIGYGESQPVADNATAEGKRKNRRIVISVRDPAATN